MCRNKTPREIGDENRARHVGPPVLGQGRRLKATTLVLRRQSESVTQMVGKRIDHIQWEKQY
jgi:hypothetical protein